MSMQQFAQDLDGWAEELKHARREQRETVMSRFVSLSAPLRDLTQDQLIAWLQEREVSPFVLLAAPGFTADEVEELLTIYTPFYISDEQVRVLLTCPQFLNAEAVNTLAQHITNNPQLRFTKGVFLSEVSGREAYVSHQFCEPILTKVHSLDALKAWTSAFPFAPYSIEAELRSALLYNEQRLLHNTGPFKPVLELFQLYHHRGLAHEEFFRNVPLWGLVRETPQHLKECMEIVGDIVRQFPHSLADLVSQMDTCKELCWLDEARLERLVDKYKSNNPVRVEVYNDVHQGLVNLGRAMYPIFSAHGFTVGAAQEMRIMADHVDAHIALWIWNAFLAHATDQQWGDYLQQLEENQPLVQGVHRHLSDQPAYMKKLLQLEIVSTPNPCSHSVTAQERLEKRKM